MPRPKCPYCQGSGRVEVWSADELIDTGKRCSPCDGTGHLTSGLDRAILSTMKITTDDGGR